MNNSVKSQTISIVTSSFNQAAFIGATIESVISQEGDFYIDYIIKDGKSSDNSVEIIKDYEQLLKSNCDVELIDGIAFYKAKNDFQFCKCKGVSFRWVSEKDNGHADGLNWGFKQSFGEFMGWINSDDLYHAGAFQKLINVFHENPQINWIMGRNTWWDKNGNEIADYLMLKNKWDFLRGNYGWIQQESTFWKRNLWDLEGSFIDTDYKFMVDNELWTRFFLQDKLYIVDEKLAGYRVWGENRAKLNSEQVVAEMDRIIAELKAQITLKEKVGLFILKLSIVLQRKLGKANPLGFVKRFYPYLVIDNDMKLIRIPYDVAEKTANEIGELYDSINKR